MASCIFQSGPLPDLSFPTSLLPTSIGKSVISLLGVDIGNTYRPRRYAGDSDSMDYP